MEILIHVYGARSWSEKLKSGKKNISPKKELTSTKLKLVEQYISWKQETLTCEASYCEMNASPKRLPTPDAETMRAREPTLEETVNTKLIESGEKERLKELLRERLVECGWRDEMKALCREFARKKGRDSVTLDDLIDVITPKGRASVPDSVKAEMLQQIQSFLASTAL